MQPGIKSLKSVELNQQKVHIFSQSTKQTQIMKHRHFEKQKEKNIHRLIKSKVGYRSIKSEEHYRIIKKVALSTERCAEQQEENIETSVTRRILLMR